MLLQQGDQEVGFIEIAGGGLRGGDDFLRCIDRTVDLVAELGLAAVEERGIRVGSRDVASILLFIAPGGIRALALLLQTGLQFLIALVQLAF